MNFLTESSFWLSVGLVSALILVVYLWRRNKQLERAKSDRVDYLYGIIDEELTTQLIPPPPKEISERHAAERRHAIYSVFQRYGIAPDELSIGPETSLPIEFLEIPPGFDSPRRQFAELESLEERAGQMARLQWQLDSDELLLAERVVDVILTHRRRGSMNSSKGLRSQSIAYPLVRLSSYDQRLASQGLFPWKVIIETDTPMFDQQLLLEAGEWLGIGVELAPRRSVRLFGQCQVDGGLTGIAGGVIEGDQGRYSMTCSHVLSSKCNSVRLRGTPQLHSNQPDAALIAHENPCFRMPPALENCFPANAGLIKKTIMGKTAVEKRHPEARRNQGVIIHRVFGFDLNGSYCRFPHLEVIPLKSNLLSARRIFDRAFSKEGESGSWVFETESGGWVGMVVGGDDRDASFVAEAGALLNYFHRAFPQSRIGSRLQPKYPVTE